VGFGGGLEPYNGRFFPGEVYFSSLDSVTNRLTVKKPTSGRRAVRARTGRSASWPTRNPSVSSTSMSEQRQDDASGHLVYGRQDQHLHGSAAEATAAGKSAHGRVPSWPGRGSSRVIGDGRQWVYSFPHNTWAPLALETDAPLGFASPYAPGCLLPRKYGVLVNVGSHSRGTAVMRPDVSTISWGTK